MLNYNKILIRFFQVTIPLALGIFLIWYVYKDLSEDQKSEIFRSFAGAEYFWVIISIALGVLSHVLRAIRWNLLIETVGNKPKVNDSFAAVMVGYLANYALPRVGEVVRCGIISRKEKIPFEKVVGTVIIERTVDMLITLILTAAVVISEFDVIKNFLIELVAPLGEKVKNIGMLFIAGGILILLFILASYFFVRKTGAGKKTIAFIKGMLEGIRSIILLKHRGQFILYSLLIWFLYYAMFHICLFCIEQTSGLAVGAVMAGFIMGGYGIILVQGGIGAFPAFVMKTLSLYQVPEEYGYAFGWILWTAQTVMILILGTGALYYLFSFRNKKSNI